MLFEAKIGRVLPENHWRQRRLAMVVNCDCHRRWPLKACRTENQTIWMDAISRHIRTTNQHFRWGGWRMALCVELCHAFVRCSFMCVWYVRLTSIHRDNESMWDISAFFSCHFAFISSAVHCSTNFGPFMRFRHNVDIAKYFTCLTWLFCADHRYHQQHKYTQYSTFHWVCRSRTASFALYWASTHFRNEWS